MSNNSLITNEQAEQIKMFYNPMGEGKDIMSVLLNLSMEYTKSLYMESNWGIYFHDKKAKVITGPFAVYLDNLTDTSSDGNFYDFIEGSVTPLENKMVATLAENDVEVERPVLALLGSIKFPESHGKVTFQLNNIMNRLNALPREVLQKTRVVIAESIQEERDQVLVFQPEGPIGLPTFRHARIPLPIIPAPESDIRGEFIRPGVPYVCEMIGQDKDRILCNVKFEYSKARLGIKVAEPVYEAELAPDMNTFKTIQKETIVYSSSVMKRDAQTPVPPIHINALILLDVLNVAVAVGAELVDVHYSLTDKWGIVIESIPKSEKDQKVTILLGTLEQDVLVSDF